MKIALVSDWFLPRLGGIELQMRDLALQLRRRGHDVEIITPVPGPASVDGIPVHRLDVPRLPGAGIVFTAAAFRRVRELMVAGRYDAVHVHFGIVAPAAYGAAFIAQSLGLPTVATFHSVLRHFDIPLWLVRGAMGVQDWRVKWSAVSSVVAESIRPLVGHQPVAILPNAIDPSYWRRATDSTPDGKELRAVAVMRLHPRKRPRALVRTFAAAAGALPDGRRMTLQILGDGRERRPLERIIGRARLEGAVAVCGWMPTGRVREELHRADVFLLPSRLEAFGIAALEARCAGLPVIAMREGGARDFLVHGEDALLAATDEEFTGYLHRFATDAGLRERLVIGASLPPSGVSWDAAVDRAERLYRGALP